MDKRFTEKAADHSLEVDIIQTVGVDTEASEKLEAFRDLFLDRYKKLKRYLQESYDFEKVHTLEYLVIIEVSIPIGMLRREPLLWLSKPRKLRQAIFV